jgi:cytosine/adenosine deaminase-related metal-dependent hydrolase
LAVTAECVQAIRDLGEARLQCYVGPSAICPGGDPHDESARQQIAGVKRIVEQYGTGLHSHAYRGQVRAAHQIDPEILGPHVCLAHCAGIEPDEIEILAASKTAATHGPLTHAYVLDRFGVIEALAAGVNVVFSTDGSAPDRSFDLLDQARIGRQLQRVHFHDDRLLPAGKVLAMITIDAARALNLHHAIGSLEPGKRADVIMLNGRAAHLAPNLLAPLRIVGHASGHDVDSVIVNGRVLMEHRVVTGVDETAILDDAERAFAATYARTNFGDPNKLHPDTWHGLRYRQLG